MPDKWRSELAMARKFVKAVNDHGGYAELIHLPEIGIHGNSNFLMAEKKQPAISSVNRKLAQEKQSFRQARSNRFES